VSDNTHIQWTEATWNVVSGCTRVSDGCTHCYIERTPPMRMAHRRFDRDGIGGTTGVQLHPDRLAIPLHWRKPRRIFVCSLADLFHDSVPDEYIADIFRVMAAAPQHTFQVLTKRHARMRLLLNRWTSNPLPVSRLHSSLTVPLKTLQTGWPLPNVWIGVSTENQQWASIRGDALRETPAAVRFFSCEPLLGPLPDLDLTGIGWVIVGGESGPQARPMHPDWARNLRDQCTAAGVPFFFKQRGEWTWNEPDSFCMPTRPYSDRVAVMHPTGATAMTKGNPFNPFERGHPYWATRIERVGKKRAGRLLDGREWNEFPQVTHA